MRIRRRPAGELSVQQWGNPIYGGTEFLRGDGAPSLSGKVVGIGMWTIGLSHWSEFIIRAAVVYVFLLVLLRVTGKRQVGQMAPFDMVLLLILSNAVQNSMNGGDNSITGGLILATTLVSLNWLVGWLSFKSKRIERLIEGRPIILVHHGRIDEGAMQRAQMTQHELETAIREAGYAGPEEARFAILETNGFLSVIPFQKP